MKFYTLLLLTRSILACYDYNVTNVVPIDLHGNEAIVDVPIDLDEIDLSVDALEIKIFVNRKKQEKQSKQSKAPKKSVHGINPVF